MKPLPFRLKIALLSAGIAGLALLASGTAAWLIVRQQKIESVDTEIRSLGARHPGWIANADNYQRLDNALAFIFGEAHENQILLMVKATPGPPLYTSAGWPRDLDPARLDLALADDPNAVTVGRPRRDGLGPELGRGRGGPGRGAGSVTFTKIPKFQTVPTTNGTWRLGILGTADRTLVIGLNYAPFQAELSRLRNGFLGALILAFLVVASGGWIVAGRALQPMTAIAETAERVTASGLDARIPTANEAPEIARVIHVLNRMMDRLEASFRQATRFSADASHELKTPLSIMQGELENALQSAPPGSPEQQVYNHLLEEIQRLTTITRSLLLLAQADAGQLKLALQPLELSAELDGMIEDARVLAADHHLTFHVQVQPGVHVQADRALLHTALFNLLVNAIKYNEPEGSITLALSARPNAATFRVCNSGPAIPEEDKPHVFDRFFRARRAGTPSGDGLGLGLSLAREIVRAHGGELALTESRPGLTCFELRLPPDQKTSPSPISARAVTNPSPSHPHSPS